MPKRTLGRFARSGVGGTWGILYKLSKKQCRLEIHLPLSLLFYHLASLGYTEIIMKFTTSLTALALSAIQVAASPVPVELAPRATPTVYFLGDSTMAKDGANDGFTDGW